MFSDTLDKDRFNIKLLDEEHFLNFFWNGSCAEMALYKNNKKLESFEFDNELYLEYIISMYFDEDFFLKTEADKGLKKGLYKTQHKIDSVMNQPYMSKSYNIHFEDMNENSMYIIFSKEDNLEPYSLIMNGTEVEIDPIIIRNIRFCVGYLETAQYNYEKRTLIN